MVFVCLYIEIINSQSIIFITQVSEKIEIQRNSSRYQIQKLENTIHVSGK